MCQRMVSADAFQRPRLLAFWRHMGSDLAASSARVFREIPGNGARRSTEASTGTRRETMTITRTLPLAALAAALTLAAAPAAAQVPVGSGTDNNNCTTSGQTTSGSNNGAT